MALPSSFADVYTDVQKLLLAATANAEAIPELATAKAELERLFTELQDLSVRRDNINAEKQALSQRLKTVKLLAREKSSELRSFLRFKLGMRNEKLVEFKVPPRRPGQPRTRNGSTEAAKRSSKAAKPATPVTPPTPPAPDNPATTS